MSRTLQITSRIVFALIASCVCVFLFSCALSAAPPQPTPAPQSSPDARLQNAYKFQQGGWIYVHLEGSPEHIGFQHGYLLAREIADALEAVKLEDTHTIGR
jgi:hypothetical protein